MKSPKVWTKTAASVRKRDLFVVQEKPVKTVNSWYTYVFLIGFYIMYLLLGAFVFQYFEERHEVSFWYIIWTYWLTPDDLNLYFRKIIVTQLAMLWMKNLSNLATIIFTLSAWTKSFVLESENLQVIRQELRGRVTTLFDLWSKFHLNMNVQERRHPFIGLTKLLWLFLIIGRSKTAKSLHTTTYYEL